LAHLWTGRALQAENDDLEKVGLALLYPPSHEGACVKLLHSELPSYLSNCSSVVARPGITAPIASASKPEQVGDLVKATTLKLSTGQIAVLERASARDG
jgi:hypothetical protein